jgi:hypothetical protein
VIDAALRELAQQNPHIPGLRPVLAQRTIEHHQARRAQLDLIVARVERALGGGDEQPEHQRRERGNEPDRDVHDVAGLLAHVLGGQHPA